MIKATLRYGDNDFLIGTWADVSGHGGVLVGPDPDMEQALVARVRTLATGAYMEARAMPVQLAGMAALVAELRLVSKQWTLHVEGLPEGPPAPTTGRISY